MKKAWIRSVCLLCLTALLLTGCGREQAQKPTDPVSSAAPTLGAAKDYAGSVVLNMGSETAKQKVTVKTYVDGDTTHFHVPASVQDSGVLKARYLGINTPESTGKIEEYGKAASRFTKEKLSSATSIIIESETDTWNPDSTGSRYLAWVWYRTSESEPYRNLNIELLQNGLAKAHSVANNRYGSTCVSALNQAKAQGLGLHSGQPDPEFYYGEAMELTLRELRLNVREYEGMKVAFDGVVTLNGSNSVYVESYDPEGEQYFGICVYYGFNLPGEGLEILTPGNEVRIVGTVQYYEPTDTYQISGLTYRMMKPDDPGNIQKISDGHEPAYVPTTAETFRNGKVTLQTEEGEKVFDYAALALGTSIEMKGLHVLDVSTSNDQESASYGAMTLHCELDGLPISVRTAVLLDENKELITADAYKGKTVDVKGIVDSFGGEYQIKVYAADAIHIYD